MPIVKVDGVPIGGSFAFANPDSSEPCLLLRTGEQTFLARHL